jgi:hypothetical protein
MGGENEREKDYIVHVSVDKLNVDQSPLYLLCITNVHARQYIM